MSVLGSSPCFCFRPQPFNHAFATRALHRWWVSPLGIEAVPVLDAFTSLTADNVRKEPASSLLGPIPGLPMLLAILAGGSGAPEVGRGGIPSFILDRRQRMPRLLSA